MKSKVQIICAPSILGLKPDGVELLGNTLLEKGLARKLTLARPILNVSTLNEQYNFERDSETGCINPTLIRSFSISLADHIYNVVSSGVVPLVLGGDCSILIGIMAGLKKIDKFGLVFIDAHADFYQPSRSTTGHIADMDLAIVTGRGPDMLTNINGMKPYIEDRHVIHLGQRDAEEAKKYKSQDIRDTEIRCLDLEYIKSQGLDKVIKEVVEFIFNTGLNSFWIHFDTDVIDDNENPAVNYRLPGGLPFRDTQYLLTKLLNTHKIAGMSVTIFNPKLDASGEIAKKITNCIALAFDQFTK